MHDRPGLCLGVHILIEALFGCGFRHSVTVHLAFVNLTVDHCCRVGDLLCRGGIGYAVVDVVGLKLGLSAITLQSASVDLAKDIIDRAYTLFLEEAAQRGEELDDLTEHGCWLASCHGWVSGPIPE